MEKSISKGQYLTKVIISLYIICELINDFIYYIYYDFGKVGNDIIRLILTVVLMYYFYIGLKWSKILIIILSFAGALFVLNYGLLHLNNNIITIKLLGIMLCGLGVTYIIMAASILFNKNIRSFLNYKESIIPIITRRDRVKSFFHTFGFFIIICSETWAMTVATKNIIADPKLFWSGILLLPVKLPLYAIPGLLFMLIGSLIFKDK